MVTNAECVACRPRRLRRQRWPLYLTHLFENTTLWDNKCFDLLHAKGHLASSIFDLNTKEWRYSFFIFPHSTVFVLITFIFHFIHHNPSVFSRFNVCVVCIWNDFLISFIANHSTRRSENKKKNNSSINPASFGAPICKIDLKTVVLETDQYIISC